MGFKNCFFTEKNLKTKNSPNFIVLEKPLKMQILDSQSQQNVVAYAF